MKLKNIADTLSKIKWKNTNKYKQATVISEKGCMIGGRTDGGGGCMVSLFLVQGVSLLSLQFTVSKSSLSFETYMYYLVQIKSALNSL